MSAYRDRDKTSHGTQVATEVSTKNQASIYMYINQNTLKKNLFSQLNEYIAGIAIAINGERCDGIKKSFPDS